MEYVHIARFLRVALMLLGRKNTDGHDKTKQTNTKAKQNKIKTQAGVEEGSGLCGRRDESREREGLGG